MSDSPLDRIQDLFDRAVALPRSQREAFLDEACAGESDLRAEVEDLLRADESFVPGDADGILPPVLRRTAQLAGEQPLAPAATPERIGPFRILRLVAAGGMGAVYEAEQDNPRRLVALKIIHAGVSSPALLQRGRNEAQILARLHHPGIVKVYAADTDPDGRPYFAMEFVRGQHLDEYATLAGLIGPARIKLMARVCDAVHHAHEQGIVHRDLKPANIIVDQAGQPKVLDFGVARVTLADRPPRDDLTRTGQFIGTPNYMSPEQLTGPSAAVDHRADVYALGVILFKLLTNRLPYPLDGCSIGEAARVIREVDPPKLGAVAPVWRGDVETIVAKALEKDPQRRYQTAAEFAADLRHHLAHETIVARPPTALYLLRKFVRRNRALVGGAAATAMALVLGLVGTLIFAVGESRQRAIAEGHARESEYQTYRARIAAASAAIASHDVEDAARHLAAAPTDLRGWEWRYLTARLDDSAAVVPLPNPGGAFLTNAPDRLRVGSMTPNGLRFIDLEGGAAMTEPGGAFHEYHVTSVQTPLGLRVAGWLDRKTVGVIDGTGKLLTRWHLATLRHPQPLALSPDGTKLATAHWANEDHRLVVFDVTAGRPVAECAGHTGDVWGYTFSPDGTRLAAVSEDQTARVWDASTGAPVAVCRGHTRKVLGVAFRPDGQRLATASSDGTVRQWDPSTGDEAEAPYDRHTGEVAAVAYSPDGSLVASAGTDRTVRVWRAAGRGDVSVLHGHSGPVVRLAFAPGGRRLASLSLTWVFSRGEDAVRVWDIAPHGSRTVLRGHTQSVYPVAFSPDGRVIATGSWDATVMLWDAASGEVRATLLHPGVVPALAYGPDGTWLITGTIGDDRLRVWDTGTGVERKSVHGARGEFRFLTLSPTGERVAATSCDGQRYAFQVCDLVTGDRLHSADGRALAYSPDGRWLATLDADGRTVVLLDARTHEPAARLIGHERDVNRGVFSTDGRLLATCGQDRTVRLWPLEGGECRVLRGHTDEIFAVAFHPDGSRLASAGRDRAIWLWDLARGEDVARLPGHTDYVWSLAFTADGAALASGSGDATVRLWDTVAVGIRRKAQ